MNCYGIGVERLVEHWLDVQRMSTLGGYREEAAIVRLMRRQLEAAVATVADPAEPTGQKPLDTEATTT